MIKMSKFVIGIRPSTKIFRLSSQSGLVVDAILADRGKKSLDDHYYTKVLNNTQNMAEVRLINDDESNSLILNWNNIIFTKNIFDVEKTIDLDRTIDEFSKIWGIIDEIMNIRDVRRIGLFAEHKIAREGANVSKILLDTLTTINKPAHPGKFVLTYEERRPTEEGAAPDIEKSDMFNIIHSYYDSEADATDPEKQSVKADIDVQRYFSPLTSAVLSEVSRLKKVFIAEEKRLSSFLHEKRLASNA